MFFIFIFILECKYIQTRINFINLSFPQAGLVEVEEGMFIIKLPHFVIPLIVRKSDGTYAPLFQISYSINPFFDHEFGTDN